MVEDKTTLTEEQLPIMHVMMAAMDATYDEDTDTIRCNSCKLANECCQCGEEQDGDDD